MSSLLILFASSFDANVFPELLACVGVFIDGAYYYSNLELTFIAKYISSAIYTNKQCTGDNDR